MTHPDPSRAPEMEAGRECSDEERTPVQRANNVIWEWLQWAKQRNLEPGSNSAISCLESLIREAIELHEAALLSRADTPAGAGGDVVTVPVEPTEAMIAAGTAGRKAVESILARPNTIATWEAMIRAAAPQAERAE